MSIEVQYSVRGWTSSRHARHAPAYFGLLDARSRMNVSNILRPRLMFSICTGVYLLSLFAANRTALRQRSNIAAFVFRLFPLCIFSSNHVNVQLDNPYNLFSGKCQSQCLRTLDHKARLAVPLRYFPLTTTQEPGVRSVSYSLNVRGNATISSCPEIGHLQTAHPLAWSCMRARLDESRR